MLRHYRNSILTKIKIFILTILFGALCHPLCFPGDNLGLSGKYKDYNVILIIADSLRPDYLGCYGFTEKASPNIDALARKGIIFTNAFCQMPLTMPSVVSIFTSLYPKSHATYHIFKDSVPEGIYTLAEILKAYGYQTGWFGSLKDPHTGANKSVLRGFKTYKADMNFIRDGDEITDVSFDNVLQWLRQQKKKPVFLVVHTYMPHIRFFPFFDFKNKFSRKVSRAYRQWRKNALALSKKEAYLEITGEKKDFLSVAEQKMRTRHDANRLFMEKFEGRILKLNDEMFYEFLLYLDSAIFEMDRLLMGRMIKELQGDGLAKKTIIIITADHGDEHREHGRLDHGAALYDESIHVPLIVYLPGLDKGKKIDAFIQSIDILPTILDLLGIPVPHQAQGTSFVDLINDKEGALREYVFSRSIDGKYMIRSRGWKFIDNPIGAMQGELYNLKNDPKEQKNLVHDNAKAAKNLRDRLLTWESGLPIYGKNMDRQFFPHVDRETQERIKKTGYW